ncbi:MAG: histidinol-phosphatase HisJ family protein [Clostridia bacterium]|nr:histidinol-phosphatase HisJ family protein [Clostridia bacterium]
MEKAKTKQPILTDVHNHSNFSPDGVSTLTEMAAEAFARGVAYYGISEHINYDVCFFVPEKDKANETTNEQAYNLAARKLQREYAGKMEMLVGAEFGYLKDSETLKAYCEYAEKYRPDFIVNSIHLDGKTDYYLRHAFYEKDGSLREKKTVYAEYLSLVKESLSAPYPYDIVGHIGYSARYAPYPDKGMRYEDFKEEFDSILTEIISREKILEVNGSAQGLAGCTVTDESVVRRYFALGGREVSYASDAHQTISLMRGREEVIAFLKEIGFTYITVPCRGKKIKIEI